MIVKGLIKRGRLIRNGLKMRKRSERKPAEPRDLNIGSRSEERVKPGRYPRR
jgi:hypothetical protein